MDHGRSQLQHDAHAPPLPVNAPSINVLGAYFPSWMLCILVGIALTLVGHRVLAAAGLEAWIGPRGIVYPALALAFTLGVWVGFFRG